MTALMDVAVAPHSLFEGDFYFCPLKVLEYAAAGCAVVAADQGDIPQLLDHGKAGVLLSDNTIDAWKRAVRDLLEDPIRRGVLGASARERALNTMTWEATATRVAGVLAGVLNKIDRGGVQHEANLPHFERADVRGSNQTEPNSVRIPITKHELESSKIT